jgi:hypothetical protein
MGQNVNYLLGNQSQLMGADPELYRQQLIQQEQARIQAMPAQNQLGAQLGGLLGRGISNVANDRGFFEVTNPVLQKLQKIQSIYDTSMQQADPNDPLSFYTTLQKQFADAGLGQQSMMAAVEAQKFEQSNLTGQKLKTEVYKNNPALLDTQIEKARSAGNDPLANQLAQQRGQIQISIDADRAMDVAKLALVNAQTAAQRATASRQLADMESSKSDWKPISEYDGGPPVAFAILDKKTKQITYEKIGGGEYIPKAPGAGGTKPAAGERRPLGEVLNPSATTTQPTAAPRKVGPVEQIALDRLAERQNKINSEQAGYNQNMAQGRQDVNALVAVAAQQGFQPMGMRGSEILFIDPRTGEQRTSSQF